MHGDLILVCHASTAAVRAASFPADEPLEERGVSDAVAAATDLVRPDRAWCAPSAAARQTASALGLEVEIAPAIRDCDFGRWSGRLLADVARDEPDAFRAWMTDPEFAPPGGESLTGVLRRVGAWVDERRQTPGTGLVVTHSAVIRAAIVGAVEATAATFWHLDAGPLSQAWLRTDGRRWTLRGVRQ